VANSLILVVALEPVAGALLALLAELAGHTPVFPRPGELPRDAVSRLGPHLVLLDGDHEAADTDEFYLHVGRTDVRVILFSSSNKARATERLASQRGAMTLTLPTNRQRLHRAITDALAA
jgi:hypothetical protein